MTTLADLTATTPGLPCRTIDPDLWFSDNPNDRRYAASQCGTCPLMAPCAMYAAETEQRWGVWGGVDRTSVVTHCGSDRGFQIHRRNREVPCGPCQTAHDTAVEVDRRRRLLHEHAAGGSVRGYWIHRKLGESACEACKGALARQSLERRERDREAGDRARAAWGMRKAAEALRAAPAGAQPLALAG